MVAFCVRFSSLTVIDAGHLSLIETRVLKTRGGGVPHNLVPLVVTCHIAQESRVYVRMLNYYDSHDELCEQNDRLS